MHTEVTSEFESVFFRSSALWMITRVGEKHWSTSGFALPRRSTCKWFQDPAENYRTDARKKLAPPKKKPGNITFRHAADGWHSALQLPERPTSLVHGADKGHVRHRFENCGPTRPHDHRLRLAVVPYRCTVATPLATMYPYFQTRNAAALPADKPPLQHF